jgi:small neutral amino acid transporter SnatA (MarC family)
MNSTYAVFAIFAGIFTIVGAAADWDWFMNNHRARLFVSLFGRDGARVFYVILGLLIIVLGFAMG